MDRTIVRLGTVLFGGFVIVALALGYWQVLAAPALVGGSNNPRVFEEAARVQRGAILDRNGQVLARSVETERGFRREYELPAAVHAIGYFSQRFGSSGIEQRYGDFLAGERSPDLAERLRSRLLHQSRQGADVVLTLDARIQTVAARVMGSNRGAVVVLDPRTGAVLALLSTPYFDPNELDETWTALREAQGDPLFNRALQATYTPGSIFKTVTATAVVDLGKVDLGEPFTCSRPITVDTLRVDCRNHAHLPRLTFQEAFAWSSNRTFALTGLALGQPGPINPWLSDDPPRPYPWRDGDISASVARLVEYGERFGFGREIPFDLPVSVSSLKSEPDWTVGLLAQTAFGQGQLAQTPLLVALEVATIANGGRMPAPYLAAEAIGPQGSAVRLHEPGGTLEQVMQPRSAEVLNEFMIESVARGYGGRAAVPGVQVGGKTGTAEVGPGREPHSWFAGYAPANDPRIAVAVVMENRGSGADFATPAAGQILTAALDLYSR